MNRAEVLTALELGPHSFLEEHIFDQIPFVFGGNRGLYISWKRKLANLLEVDAACLTIVGSAAIGCSLTPGNNLKAFTGRSDIDVAVISDFHFTVAWRYLRNNGGRRRHVDAATRIAWQKHVDNYVFWGTIATDRLLGVLPFGMPWLKALKEMSDDDPTRGRDVNIRLYQDFDSLRSYQISSLRSLRNSLA